MNLKLALIIILPVSAGTLLAQKVVTGPATEFGQIGITTAVAGRMPTVAGAPYSAEGITEHTQTLADGNRIHQTITSQVARDSQGRIRREESFPGPANPPQLIMIDDPVAGIHWTLNPANKTASKLPVKHVTTVINPAGAPEGGMTVSSDGGGPITIAFAGGAPPKDANGPDDAVKTDLGTQTIEGVTAQGTRITHTIPAGQVGNDQPLVITTETWMSPDLKVLVMSKTSDPRMGETTYRLTNILRAEPDPALFQVPPDYTIQDKPSLQPFPLVVPAKPE
jgi:hypothetical protein